MSSPCLNLALKQGGLQEEKEEVATAKVAALSEKEKITGLLSRAFRQPPPRSASLHNLLDLQHDDVSVSHPRHYLHQHAKCMKFSVRSVWSKNISVYSFVVLALRLWTYRPDGICSSSQVLMLTRNIDFQDGPAEKEAAAAPSQQAPDSQDAAQSGAQRRRGGHWEGKASIIDQLNELVGELRDIDSNIALHVRLSRFLT